MTITIEDTGLRQSAFRLLEWKIERAEERLEMLRTLQRFLNHEAPAVNSPVERALWQLLSEIRS